MAREPVSTTPTSLSLFMRDMGHYPLLTKEQEELLTHSIHLHKQELIWALAQTSYFKVFVRMICDQCDRHLNAHQRLLAQKTSQRNGKKIITTLLKALTNFQEGVIGDDTLRAVLAPIKFNWPLMLDDGLMSQLVALRDAHDHGVDLPKGTTLDDVHRILTIYEETLQTIKQFERHNIRLIISVAKNAGRGQPLDDRVQWGYMGLRKAIWRFDPSTGNKFSTYGTWWIKQSIMREYMNTAGFIRMPIHLQDKLKELRAARDTQQAGSQGNSIEDPATEMSEEDLEQFFELNRLDYILSLDAPLGSDPDSGNLLDVYDTEAPNPCVATEQADTYEKALVQMRRLLSPREVQIIIARYVEGRTLEDVGRQFNVSRERIRQLEVQALRILRNSVSFREVMGVK